MSIANRRAFRNYADHRGVWYHFLPKGDPLSPLSLSLVFWVLPDQLDSFTAIWVPLKAIYGVSVDSCHVGSWLAVF